MKELSSPAMFWTDDRAQRIENYGAAKKPVAEILGMDGSSRFYETLSSIESGKSFSKALGAEKH